MRAQVTIEHVTLSARMAVTVLDFAPEGTTVDRYVIDRDDAEYQLLAQAIDRFVRVQSLKATDKQGDSL